MNNQTITERPGIREQHLLRKMDNPLFDEAQRQVGKDDLAQARLEDGVAKDRFVSDFQALVQRAVDLEPDAPSETVLELKEALDRSYQEACALPGDMETVKQSIRRLVGIIMQAVRAAAGDDSRAQQELMEEDAARQAHYELQELPLVAALMHPDSPIAAHELIPSLLSEAGPSLSRTLTLFDEQQLARIFHDAAAFLAQRDPTHNLPEAWQRLEVIEHCYRRLQPATPPN
jgi:hypothetical protein